MLKKARHIIFLWTFIQVILQNGMAQVPVPRMLDYEMGLPSNTVYNILQDSKGYIWIGHDKGLTRYNGSDFKNYSSNMNQSRALSNIEEDKFGRIWCQNFSGEIFYTESDSLHEFRKFGSTGNYLNVSIFNKKQILSVRGNELMSFDLDENKVKKINTGGYSVCRGNLHSSASAFYCFTLLNHAIIKIPYSKKPELIKLPQNIHPLMFFEFKNKLIVLPSSGLNDAAIVENGKCKTVGIHLKILIQHAGIINGEIWVATSEGIYRFDENLNLLYNGKPLYPELNVSKVLRDHEGSIWISTLNKGIVILPNLDVQFVKLNLPNPSILAMSFFSSTNKVILGTGYNQLVEFNQKDNSLNLLYDFKLRHDITKIYNDVPNDLIWVGSDQMYAIRPGTNSIEYKKSFSLKDMVYLDKNTYALAGSDGVSLFSYQGDTLNNYFSKLFQNQPEKWAYDRQFIFGSEGRSKCVEYNSISQTLYASNYKGLFYWTKNTKGKILDDQGKPIYATDILVNGNKVYVVTYSGALLFVNGTKVEKKINAFQGLEKKSIIKIESFGDNLWMLFENAIVKYNLISEKYVAIKISDGLPNTEIKDMVVADNNVYLATRIGLVKFHENMGNSPLVPLLEIEDIFVNRIKRTSNDFSFDLKYNENNLEIYFSILSYRQNAGVNAYYSINGKEWIVLGSSTKLLKFIGLSPGQYNIRIKLVKPDGSEIFFSQTLKFRIASPIWSQWWFILICVVVIGFLAYSFMRFRLNELRKEAEFKTAKERMEKEIQMSTLTSIKSQMNPHFVFNALNTVQSYIFTNDKDNAIEYLNKFSDLTRMILDMSNREMIPLSEEIRALNLYLDLESIRFEDNFTFELKVNENVNTDLIQIPSMLIQPYVENAIKHGLLHIQRARKLKVEFLREDNALIVFVDDNGIGRKKSEEMKLSKKSGHKSFATEANKKRLQLLNQGRANTIDIEFLDKTDGLGRPNGTMVILAIPINF